VRGRALLAAALAGLAILVAPAAARACSCIAIAPETRFEQSHGAVIARLDAVVPRGPSLANFRYEVREVFKARRRLHRGQTLVIRSVRGSASCGLPEDEGRRYGLFLRRSDRGWQAGLCDVTSPQTMREVGAQNRRVRGAGPCAV